MPVAQNGALPFAAKPLTPGYFNQNESRSDDFILVQISPPEAQADPSRAGLKEWTAP